jgi:hypothetical protein
MSKQFFELLFEVLKEIDPNEFNMVYSSPNGMTVLRSNEYYSRLEQINDLKQENARLQQRIDKAIEYIESNKCDKELKFQDKKYYSDYLINETLEILKGRE